MPRSPHNSRADSSYTSVCRSGQKWARGDRTSELLPCLPYFLSG
ncbi:hypothetical protein [Chroococcidiopsis sp. CCNUC1]|nr:hypothetical protein [Chroococcidiopsis sp. CCNUC1]